MSEKYKDAIEYYESQQKEEWERERKFPWNNWEESPKLQTLEEKFYRSTPRTPALEAAIKKVEECMQELAVKKQGLDLSAIENVFIKGDIAAMNEIQRVDYVRQLCRSLGLNPLTNPFDYISFQGKTVLYAKKSCTEQLRVNFGVSIGSVTSTIEDGILSVMVTASTPDGRNDTDMGCVNIQGLKGDALCNAKMKALTKAKRRVTLSICGLGIMDESETDTISGAKKERVFEQEEYPKIDKNQITNLYAIAKEKGFDSKVSVNEFVVKEVKRPVLDMTSADLEKVLKKLYELDVKPPADVVDQYLVK